MICKLTDNELVSNIKIKVKHEKLIVVEVLNYLEEIDRRKVFVDYGTSSLFKFCTRILKYSDAEAAIRVKTIHALKFAPIIKEKIKDEALNLTTAASLYSFFKNNKITNRFEVVNKVCGRSAREVKDILNSLSNNPLPRKLTLTLPEYLIKKLEKVGLDFEDCSELEVIESLIDKHLEQVEHSKAKRKPTKASTNQRHIPRDVREAIDKRAKNRCEGVAPITGKRCNSRVSLEYDHLRPIALGGESSKENLRKLCKGCNQRAGVKALGLHKMARGTGPAETTPSTPFFMENTEAGLQYSFIMPGR